MFVTELQLAAALINRARTQSRRAQSINTVETCIFRCQ